MRLGDPRSLGGGQRLEVHPPAPGRFYYEVAGKQAALTAAETFCYGDGALIQTGAAGLKPLEEMLSLLRTIAGDHFAGRRYRLHRRWLLTSGEVMNLLVRDNLLFQLVTSPDRRLKLNVKLGTKEYPLSGR